MDSSADRPAKMEGKGEYYPDYAAKKIMTRKPNTARISGGEKIIAQKQDNKRISAAGKISTQNRDTTRISGPDIIVIQISPGDRLRARKTGRAPGSRPFRLEEKTSRMYLTSKDSTRGGFPISGPKKIMGQKANTTEISAAKKIVDQIKGNRTNYTAKKIIDQKQNHISLLQAKKIVIPISPDRQG